MRLYKFLITILGLAIVLVKITIVGLLVFYYPEVRDEVVSVINKVSYAVSKGITEGQK